ncbi:MAG: ABC transporter substrate-binding protein [Oscillibacter sp.]|nr:ABC transporter substrate-binding protein [Oscillibacter sp.]
MGKFKKWMSLALALIMCIGLLTACGGGNNSKTPEPQQPGTTTPDATPSTPSTPDPAEIAASGFSEAPYITSLGTYGAVEDRLPVADDIMVESVDAAGNPLAIGVYGGELKRSAGGGNWDAGKPVEEGLFRFNTSAEVEPNVAKSYDVNDDATVYTIHLREGMKWSDGEPFTAEDCVWFYNAVCLNNLDGKGIRNCHKDANGDPAVVEKVDDTTFTVTFGTPKYDFIEALVVDLKWHYAPKHILGDICQMILDGKEAEAIAAGKELTGVEFSDSSALGKETLYYFWNYSGIPTLNPFVLSTEANKNNVKGEYYEFVRNPYYWKTDAAGQQLPYMDKIIYTTVQNVDQTLMLLLDGTVDYQTIAVQDAPTVLDAENTSGTKINLYEWSGVEWGSAAHQLHLNLGIADANKNALFNNADFRQAMSICVDRVALASALTDGWQDAGQAAPQEGTLGYSEEWSKKWTEYDVAKAKTLFESAGLVMGSDGFYDFADGTDFELTIVSVADMGAADTFSLLDTYYRAAGIKCNFRDYDRSYIDNELMAGSLECMLYPVTPIGDISIALKPNSMIPGYATNVAWYGNIKEDTATGDLLELINLKKQLDQTADADARNDIVAQMLKLHEENQWTIGYVAATPTIHAVNARIQNFPDGLVWSDIYRDMGVAHCQCWFIQE